MGVVDTFGHCIVSPLLQTNKFTGIFHSDWLIIISEAGTMKIADKIINHKSSKYDW